MSESYPPIARRRLLIETRVDSLTGRSATVDQTGPCGDGVDGCTSKIFGRQDWRRAGREHVMTDFTLLM